MAIAVEEQFNNPWEWSAVSDLVHAHDKKFGSRLRAVLVFGDLAARRPTKDIWLLEVIEDWRLLESAEKPLSFVFPSTTDLPLRGRLYYFALAPQDFERLCAEDDRLIRDVASEYEVVLEREPGYVADNLSGARQRRKLLQPSGVN